MAARYGAGSSRGRRVTGSDEPLYEPVGKSVALEVLGSLAGDAAVDGMRGMSRRQRAAAAGTAATAAMTLPALGVHRARKQREKFANSPEGKARRAAATRLVDARMSSDRRTIGIGKAYRRYDPESNRQRRVGAAQAGLVLGGGYAGTKGVQGIRHETKELRGDKLRRGVAPGKKLGGGVIEQSVQSKYGRKAIAVSRRNGVLVGGGAAAIAAAGGLHHWANSNRGRTYR